MEIRSDDEEFQQLNDAFCQIKQSIRRPPEPQVSKLIRVQIKQAPSSNGTMLVENQYYLVSVYKDGNLIKKDITKRFSDFDTLFQILFRQYKGYILPAFPQNGILSYVKSKVSLTKDDKFLRERISMVERFLTCLLNDPTFNDENCSLMKAFLSEKGFDLFKSQQKQKTQGLFSSSWNKIISYIKVSKESKFKIYQEQLLQSKLEFEELYKKIKCMVELLEEQRNWINNIESQKLNIPRIDQYIVRQKKICQEQQGNITKVKKLFFDVSCENEDYSMVLKTLKNLDELKNNEDNYTSLDTAERIFSSQYENFRGKKKESLKKIISSLNELLKDISKIDQKF